MKKIKTMEILAGPNGSGKTTLADLLFKKVGKFRFINADSIANGMDASANGAAMDAGRIMLRQIKDSLNEGINFAFETTLSGRVWIDYVNQAKDKGYEIIIYFVIVENSDLAIKRVKDRVANGGHDIPTDVVKRRYKRSIDLFNNTYSKICDKWYIFDNSDNNAEMIAKKENGTPIVINQESYGRIML